MAPFPPGPVCRVAVLPFVSDSDFPLADAIVSKVFATQFQEAGNFTVIQDGDILKAYQQLHILPGVTPTLEQLQIIANRVGAQFLITGIILEMREDRSAHGTVNPRLSVEIRICDGRSGQTLWTVLHRRQGADYEKTMHFGKINTVTGLSRQMSVEIINLWFKKGLAQCEVSP
jgi:polysaccharide biosynthesis protein PelC